LAQVLAQDSRASAVSSPRGNMSLDARKSLDSVKKVVSSIFNRPLQHREAPQELDPEVSDFDIDDPDDPALSPSDNLLRRCDSMFIAMSSFELSREFPEVEINPRLVFDNPCIESLAQAIHSLPPSTSGDLGKLHGSNRAGSGGSVVSLTDRIRPFTQLMDASQDADEAAEAEMAFAQKIQTMRKGPLHSPSAGDCYFRCTDGMECVLLPGGWVRIGTDSDPEALEDEGPSHNMELSSFLVDIEPVSIGAFVRFLNMVKPSRDVLLDWCLLEEDDDRTSHVPLLETADGWKAKPGVPLSWPMILVSWYGANAYSLWAHGQDWHSYKSAAQSFLPTEAQWEYAARGPEPARFPWGDAEATPELLKVCWDMSVYDGESHVSTPLEKLPLVAVNVQLGMSPFGLRHMAGNVWQWCRDTYHPNFYLSSDASLRDAFNSEDGPMKSERGGSWVGPASLARSSSRRGRAPEAKGRCLGFRCAAPSSLLEDLSTTAGSEVSL